MFSINWEKISYKKEWEIVNARYLSEIKSIDRSLFDAEKIIQSKPKKYEILIFFPYWLAEAMNCDHPVNIVRALAIGNLYGRWCIVSQDRIMDRQSDMLCDSSDAKVLLISNLMYYKWVKEYQRVFPAHSRFWLFFEKYLLEYTNSMLWEIKEHWGKLQDFTESDLKYLGQKLSLLKISGAGMCILNNRTDWIPLLSTFIEELQIGVQFLDDSADWREDLRNQNYTYFLTKIHREASASTLSEQEINDVLLTSTITNEILEKSKLHYLKAKEIAQQLSCQRLCRFMNDLIQMNDKRIADKKISTTRSEGFSASGLDIDTALLRNDSHCFENGGRYYVFDVNRHLVFSIDRPAYEVLQLIDSIKGSPVRSISQCMPAYSLSEITNIVKELMQVGIIRTVNQDTEVLQKKGKLLVEKKYENIVGLDLQISTCSPYHQLLTNEAAKNAINLFFRRSVGYFDNISKYTVFLSCAALESDEADVIKRVIEYSKQLETRLYKTIHFVLSIPLMQTSNDSFFQCIATDVLSSIILSTDCDNVITFSKRADVQQIVTQIKNSKKPVSVNLMLDYDLEKIREAIEILRTLCFDMIFLQPSSCHAQLGSSNIPDYELLEFEESNHFYFLNSFRTNSRAAKHNPCRFHCNAGRSYLSVTPDGNIFPCPQFIGCSHHSMGNVFNNKDINQARYLKRDVESLELCRNCWARYICGGGCMFHSQLVMGSVDTPDSKWCFKYKEQVEHLISRYYSLTPEERKKLDEAANLDIRFCDSL